MTEFHLTDKQLEAQALMAGEATHILLDGGSRSGKTFLLLRGIAMRCLKSSGARSAVLRFRFNHLVASIIEDTWPKMLDLCWPGLRHTLKDNREHWFTRFPNGSEVWWGGLDDKERTEKVLGQEHVTVLLNECSQISWQARLMVVTRLAQVVRQDQVPGKPVLRPRLYYDANPPSKGHWLYRLFYEGRDPITRAEIPNPGNYAQLLMNPEDNAENLSPAYLDELRALPKRERDRFYSGLYADENPNALFPSDVLERWRHMGEKLPEMQRVVVGVDPSGADDESDTADDIGVFVMGLGADGNAYGLEDLTLNASPAKWGKVAASAAQRHAGTVIGEVNYGGAMVAFTIRTAERDLGAHIRYQEVRATRGKVVRAEPVSALMEKGRVRLVGSFPELEAELEAFSTTGYTGIGSPNRADAFIWCCHALFPGLVSQHHVVEERYRGDYEVEEHEESWKVA